MSDAAGQVPLHRRRLKVARGALASLGRYLRATASLAALAAAMPSAAVAQTVTINGSDQNINTDPNSSPSIRFSTDNIAVLLTSITGDVAVDSNGIGILRSTNITISINDNVGTNANRVRDLWISGGKVTINGNFFGSGEIDISEGGTVELNADVWVDGDGISFQERVYNTTSLPNSLIIATDNITITGRLAPSTRSTINLNSNKLNHSGVFSFGLTSGSDNAITIKTTLTSTGNGWILTNQANVTSPSTIVIEPTISGFAPKNGDKFILVRGTGTASFDPSQFSIASSGRLSWSADDASAVGFSGIDKYGSPIAATDLVLKATVRGLAATNGITSTALHSLNAVDGYDGASSSLLSLQNAVFALENASDLNKAGNQLRPAVDRSDIDGSFLSTNQVLNAITRRTETVRLADAGSNGTGIATGEAMRGLDVWLQGLAARADQGKRGDVDGYGATTWGTAIGADARVMEQARVGLALSYANSDVNEEGDRVGSGLDIDSYGATLYGQWEGAPWYLDAALGYTRHKYDSFRTVAFTGFGGTAKAKYDGDQYVARLGGGYSIPVGGAVVTPLAHMAYSHLNTDDYMETGAPGANLTVKGQSIDSLKSGVGAEIAYPIATNLGKLVPEARAVWLHEFLDTDAPQTTAAFVDGSSTFVATGATPARNGATLGVGVSLASAKGITLSANYDAEFKSEYVGHTGKVEVRTSF